METQKEKLGKVSITVEEDYWNINNVYKKLTIVERQSTGTTYLSRKPVPAGTSINNRKYWIKFSKWSDIPYEITQEFGDSDELVISQKVLTESRDSLQAQINAIINDKATVSLSASPSPVFVGVQSNVSLVATTNTQASSIKIKKGTTEIASGSGLTLSGSDSVTPIAAGNTTYTALFTIAGLEKTATKNVVAVYPIKYGAGQAYTDATTQASARTTPAGTYSITVENDGDYVFFVVPNNMHINSAKMSGFDFPLENPVQIVEENYICYKSSNTYDAGTLTIVIE